PRQSDGVKSPTRLVVLFASALVAPLVSSAFEPAEPGARQRLGNLMDPSRVNLVENFHQNRAVVPVKLHFTVTAKGVPRGIDVVTSSGHNEIDRQCVIALKQMRFEPLIRDGVAVAREETIVMVPRT
ncbi:MAG TPA: TonB family protein, partial [Opitutaceae bacterium]|nr:TonB family protein [Opitutaceae bacterium]